MNTPALSYHEDTWFLGSTRNVGHRGFRHNDKRVGLWILYSPNQLNLINNTISFGHIMKDIKDITPYNQHGTKHGQWIQHWGNGNIGYTCKFVNGIKVGLETEFNEKGKSIVNTYFIK